MLLAILALISKTKVINVPRYNIVVSSMETTSMIANAYTLPGQRIIDLVTVTSMR